MPTYADLAAESWWNAEHEAPALATFNARLRAFYGHTKSQTGSKGDYRHLRGRHRSRNWCLNSRYCTNRTYGTTDDRDKRGDGDWLRATDIGIQGPQLHQASRRLDTAVRAGLLPCVAEWFGTFDGLVVSGWYQGKASTSDTSHLWHLHVGLWTEYANHGAQLDLLYQVITGGGDMPTVDEVWNKQYRDYVAGPDGTRPVRTAGELLMLARVDAHAAAVRSGLTPEEVAKIETAAREGAAGAVDAIVAGVLAELATESASPAEVEAAIRRVLGSLGE